MELHSWNNAKPAYMNEGAKVAERPKLGRPPKSSSSSSPSPPMSLIPTEIPEDSQSENAANETPPPSGSEAQTALTRQIKHTPKPVPKKQIEPSKHTMTLRQRN